jgi:hypothetical protein
MLGCVIHPSRFVEACPFVQRRLASCAIWCTAPAVTISNPEFVAHHNNACVLFSCACAVQVSTKMHTFSPRELAGVLVALGHLGYQPGPEWLAQVVGPVSRQTGVDTPQS